MRRSLLYGFALTLLAGCAHYARRGEPAALEAAVRGTATAWVNAFARHDLDGIAAGFAEDAVALYPRSAPTVGRAANRSSWAEFFARPRAEHPVTIDTVVVSRHGDMAFTRGRYAVRYDAPGGPIDLGGQYIAVWRPDVAGVWRVTTLAANLYSPAPALDPHP